MRIAAIRYINALPLTYGLRQDSKIDIAYDTPSGCLQKLKEGEVDVSLIPLMGLQQDPALRAVKGLGIAAGNRTESVYVFSTRPLGRIRNVLADTASTTSVMLLKVILKEKYRNVPDFIAAPVENLHDALRHFDAALLIGDEAILTDKSDYDHYDLATEWYSLSGFPAVFAVWASRKWLHPDEIRILQQSLELAENNLQRIYEVAAEQLPVDLAFLKRYYNENLHYRLTRSDYEGILRFLQLIEEFQLLEKVRKDIWM